MGSGDMRSSPVGAASVVTDESGGAGVATSTVRDLGPGAWSWFGDPRSVYAHGHTFVAFVARTGALTVVSIGTDGVRRSVLAQEPAADDHDVPALAILPSGQVVAYYCHHVGPALHWRITRDPYDITAWGPEQTLGTNRTGPWGNTYTYPHPVWLSAERRAYLFWRGGDKLPDYTTAPSLTGPWMPARTMIQVEGGARPYLRIADNGRDRMLFAFTNAHPREGVSSLYFAQYSAGMLKHASGRPIAPLGERPITPGEADMVWNAHAQGARAWVWDVAISKHGNPVITFVVFRGTRPEHEYHWARWTGSGWEDHVLAHGGGTITTDPVERWYSAGVVLDPRDPQIAYAAVPAGKHFEIARYQTNDGGHHWTRRWITQRSNTDNLRPYVPTGLPPGQDELLWLHGKYGTYKNFGTSVWALTP
jgi:BNR repeat-containing family member